MTKKINPEKDWNLSDEEWKEKLTDEQYYIMREKGTEVAFTGAYDQLKEEGTYLCSACGLPLFDSNAKYESGTGWPSFYKPTDDENVQYHEDNMLLMKRVEVLCGRCASHLGHVFNDGPKPTGKRYCINSIALQFMPDNSQSKGVKKAIDYS